MGLSRFNARRGAKAAPLFGLSLCSFDPAFIDIAAHFAFDLVWVEMEHANVSMREAELLCRIINGAGMLSLIRLPNGDRDVVLRAAETGADMLMLPMIRSVRDIEQFVNEARYSPVGQRGFHKLSRSMKFGLGDTVSELRRQAHDNLLLWGQVETLSALESLSELCQVDGIDGLFAGPGDLSAAYGVPGNVTDPRVVDAVTKCIATSHEHQKIAGSATAPGEVARWLDHGIDMLMVGNNYGCYISAAESLRSQLDRALEAATASGPA